LATSSLATASNCCSIPGFTLIVATMPSIGSLRVSRPPGRPLFVG
jgi:hypothetical protein